MTTAPTRTDPYKGFNFTVQLGGADPATADDAFFVKVDAETTTESGDVDPTVQVTLNYTKVETSRAQPGEDEFVFVEHPDATFEVIPEPEPDSPPQDDAIIGDHGALEPDMFLSMPLCDDIG